MPEIVVYLIFTVLPAIAVVLYTAYLMYVSYSRTRYNAKMDKIGKKYKKGTPVYELSRKIYTPKTVVAWLLISTYFVLAIIIDYFNGHRGPATLAAAIVGIINLAVLFIGLHILSSSLRLQGGKK